mgnify:CR=1 FL=1
MNKTELVDSLANKTGLTKTDSKKAVDGLLDIISEALVSGDAVQLVGFGTFKITERKERQGRNPANGQTITIPASKSPAFVAGKSLKDKVNKR